MFTGGFGGGAAVAQQLVPEWIRSRYFESATRSCRRTELSMKFLGARAWRRRLPWQAPARVVVVAAVRSLPALRARTQPGKRGLRRTPFEASARLLLARHLV
jgi:hypothetical protein